MRISHNQIKKRLKRRVIRKQKELVSEIRSSLMAGMVKQIMRPVNSRKPIILN
jgi:hypothetical protein